MKHTLLYHHMQLRPAVWPKVHYQRGAGRCKSGPCRADNTTAAATSSDAVTTSTSSSTSNEGPSSSAGNGMPPVDPIRQAYLDGYKAGYAAGAKVTVSVTVSPKSDRRSSSSRSGSSGSSIDSSSSGSSNSNTSGSNGVPQPERGPSSTAGSSTKQLPGQKDVEGQAPDSMVRSAVKALVWRLFSTAVTVSVALLVLHDTLQVEDALKFGGIEFAAKFISYFCYERLWIWLPKVL